MKFALNTSIMLKSAVLFCLQPTNVVMWRYFSACAGFSVVSFRTIYPIYCLY